MSEKTATTAVRGTNPTRTAEVHLPVPVPGRPVVNPQLRHDMIACAAYYRAEKRGFSGGCELEDWLEAETEIDKLMWHGLAPQSVGSKGDAE
jgi:hypothetical protein